jgi:hypothetical protein
MQKTINECSILTKCPLLISARYPNVSPTGSGQLTKILQTLNKFSNIKFYQNLFNVGEKGHEAR